MHGLRNNKLYHVWRGMLDRTTNKNNKRWGAYGGKGVKVCPEWESFYTFYDWAKANGYKPDCDLSIDRINNDGDYEPSNCRFATRSQQQNNKCNNRRFVYQGENKTVSQWARDERCKVCFNTLYHRVNVLNWHFATALTTPAMVNRE